MDLLAESYARKGGKGSRSGSEGVYVAGRGPRRRNMRVILPLIYSAHAWGIPALSTYLVGGGYRADFPGGVRSPAWVQRADLSSTSQ